MVKILVVSKGCGLFKPMSGCRNRFYNLTLQLIKKGNKLTVLQSIKYKDKLDNSLTKVLYFRHHIWKITFSILTDLNISYIKFLYKIIQDDIELIQISSPFGIFTSKLIVKISKKNIPVIYDAHNVESDLWKDLYLHGNSSILRRVLSLVYIPYIEKVAIKSADLIISVSDQDKITFIQKYKVQNEKIVVIPSGTNLIDCKSLKDKIQMKKQLGINDNKLILIFHGSYSHPPNAEAINLIKDYITPKLSSVFKDILFLIVGTGVPVFEEENIKSFGFVEDLYSFLNIADIAIVPLLNGAGTKLKMFDYMTLGLPIVTTKKGIEGINAKNYEHAIIIESVNQEFIDSIVYLINSKKERDYLGKNARILVENEYNWDKIGIKLNTTYKSVLSRGKNKDN